MDRRIFLGALAGGLLAAPLAAEAQPAPLSSVVDYVLRHGTETDLPPEMMKMLGWTSSGVPLKGKRRGIRTKDGDHHIYVVTERGGTDIVFLFHTKVEESK